MNYNELSTGELNALVAEKVMGCSIQWVNDVPFRSYSMGTAPGSPYTLSAEKIELHPVPNYCNDIAAAWQVVKVLQGKNLLVEIMAENAGDYQVTVYGYVDSVERWDEIGSGEDDNSPSRAICLAALNAAAKETP